MTMQNVTDKSPADDYNKKLSNVYYERINGIKLRDSLFIVYPPDSSYTQSEYIYISQPIKNNREMLFDNSNGSELSTGGPENCGIYKLEDRRVLVITEMQNWHYNGYIFKDEESWKQYSVFS